LVIGRDPVTRRRRRRVGFKRAKGCQLGPLQGPHPCNKARKPAPHLGGTRSMKIRPLHDRILVKRIEEEGKTKGGIIIPDSAKEKPQEGKVIAAGNGKIGDDGKVQPLDVKKGDKILFSKYAGSEVNIDDDEHLIIREDDVLGIIE
jgi:chaperonin GroES